jgi:hypothetical protein
MAMYLADVLGEEEYFVCCRCGKKHHAEKHGMTLDDVYFDWDFDTEKEYLEVFKEGEFQIHKDCDIWKKELSDEN